jgi:hypothetical protein
MSPCRLLPLLAALLTLAAPKTTPAPKPGKLPAPEIRGIDYAAASRLLAKAQPIADHPDKATDAHLARAARDLARANELEPDLDLQPWFHADLGTVLYARAKAKRGPERTYLLERADVQFHLAALTHNIGIYGARASDVIDFRAAGRATVSFILYHVGLLEYELGRPSNAVIPLHLLLAAAADHKLERPEYVEKARTLLPAVERAEEKQRQRPLPR